MRKIKNVFSCFDGISAAQQALVKSNITYDNYYASEIEKHSIKVTQKHFPNTIQLGDIRNLNGKDFQNVDLFIAGSPCTDLSILGKKKGMVTQKNVKIKSLKQYIKLKNQGFQFEGQSYLFWESIRIKNDINPKYFLFENVKMKKEWEDIFSKELGVKPIVMNSSYFSAQNRVRLYWTNIPNVQPPKDLGILLSDLIPNATGAAKRGVKPPNQINAKYSYHKIQLRKDGKANCVVTSPHTTNRYVTPNGNYLLIPPEITELLQTMPVGYTDVLPKYKRYQVLGNSMTVDAIKHIYDGWVYDEVPN